MSDYCCFKYRAVNKYLIDSLVRCRLYFPSRVQLNDPFDCNVDIEQVVSSMLAEDGCPNKDLLRAFIDDAEVLRRFHENIKSLGIGSFSLDVEQTLMWSHYAADHTGVAVRYDFPEAFLSNEEEIFGVSPVTYEENPITDWLRDNIVLWRDDHQTFVIKLLQRVLTSKAPAWKHEDEARIFRPVTGLFEIPREVLTHVVFGLDMSTEDESLIRSIVNKYYEGVKFNRIVRTGDDFGIKLEEI